MRLDKNQLILLTCSFLLSGCLGSKYLKEDEKLLYKQNVKVSKNIDKDELNQLYAQEPNRQFPILPFAPYVWLYYWGQKSYDIEKYEQKKVEITNKFDKKIAEADKKKKENRLERKKKNKLDKVNKTITEGNWRMRIGEPLAIYDSSLTKNTKDRFDLYLDSKGYFNAKVDYENKIAGN
ncbi:MAG: hypothetical protein RLO12_15600, partial [Fulvivirga sp.]